MTPTQIPSSVRHVNCVIGGTIRCSHRCMRSLSWAEQAPRCGGNSTTLKVIIMKDLSFCPGPQRLLIREGFLSPGAATVVDLPEAGMSEREGRGGSIRRLHFRASCASNDPKTEAQRSASTAEAIRRRSRSAFHVPAWGRRGAAVCVDCEGNKQKVSQRLPHSGIGELVDPIGSEASSEVLLVVAQLSRVAVA